MAGNSGAEPPDTMPGIPEGAGRFDDGNGAIPGISGTAFGIPGVVPGMPELAPGAGLAGGLGVCAMLAVDDREGELS